MQEKLLDGVAGALVRTWMRGNAKVAGAMVMGGLGLGLGDAKTGLAGSMAGYGMGTSAASANDSRIMKHELARAINKYKQENPGITNDEVINNALHFADGSLTAQTDYEKELADVMQRMEQKFVDSGMDDKKIPKQFKRLISDVNNGNISEYSTFQRFTGNVKNKFTSKVNNGNKSNVKYKNQNN